MIRITLTSVFVEDQERALRFYTEVLGFMKKIDMELPGGADRWLTVVSRADPDGVQLLLEPAGHPASQAYHKALHESGIAATSFEVDDLRKEHERLTAAGVVFRMDPTKAGSTLVAMLDDTCGNLIQLHQVVS
jgi:catechol 2,3-dioxygenase-like lactoylglutathione lyase family enzyme